MRARRFLPVLIAAAVAGACSEPAPPPPEQAALALAGPTAVAIFDDVRPIVTVGFGAHELPALVDCGAPLTLIDRGAAARLGLPLRRYRSPTTIAGSTGHSVAVDSFAVVDELRIGELRLGPLRLPAVDNADNPGSERAIVGQDLLMRFVTVVDQERRRLHLLPPDTGAAAISRYLGDQHLGDGEWAQVHADFRPTPTVPMGIPGLPAGIEIEFDTGANTTGLPRRAIAALGLEPIAEATVHGLGGAEPTRIYHVQGFNLFGLRMSVDIHEVPLEFGLLGMDILGKLVVVLDGPGRKIWLHHRVD